jgi:hypothetical protein
MQPKLPLVYYRVYYQCVRIYREALHKVPELKVNFDHSTLFCGHLIPRPPHLPPPIKSDLVLTQLLKLFYTVSGLEFRQRCRRRHASEGILTW